MSLLEQLLDNANRSLYLVYPSTVRQEMERLGFAWKYPIKRDRGSDDRLVLQVSAVLSEANCLPYMITDDLYIDWSITGELSRYMTKSSEVPVRSICRNGVFVPIPDCNLNQIIEHHTPQPMEE